MDERTQWLARIDQALSELTGRSARLSQAPGNERSEDDEVARASELMNHEQR